MRSDIVPGGTFPDYALPDHTGAVRRLSEIQGGDPLILTLARSGQVWRHVAREMIWPMRLL